MGKKTHRWQTGNGTYVIRNVSEKKKKVSWKIRIKQFRKKKTRTGKIIENSERKMRWTEESIPYCNSKEQAIEYLHHRAQEEVDKMLGKYQPKTKPISFNHFSKEYLELHAKENKKSWMSDVNRIKHLKRFFKETGRENIMLTDITTKVIEEFKKWKKYSSERKEELKPQTVNRDLNILSVMLKVAVEWEYLKEENLPKIRKLKETNDFEYKTLSFEDQKTLLKNLKNHTRDIVIFALNTGARKGEILNLKWNQVDLFNQTVTFIKTKNNRKRTIPLNQTVLSLLKKRFSRAQNEEYVFTNANTHTRFISIKKAYETARKKAGLEDLRFHDLRHTYGTRLADRSVPITTIKQLMGHADIQTTMRYVHPDEELKKKAVKLLDNLDQEGQNEVRKSQYVM